MHRQPQPRLCRGYRPSALDTPIVEICPGIYRLGSGDRETIIYAASPDEALWMIFNAIMRPPPYAAILFMHIPPTGKSCPGPRQPSLPETSAQDPPHL
ncbi:MAG: hypothetical protein K2L77_02795 [Muribaculaceae bacterium]|nr:hypothetical protein [Muribaculaceae bacterium]